MVALFPGGCNGGSNQPGQERAARKLGDHKGRPYSGYVGGRRLCALRLYVLSVSDRGDEFQGPAATFLIGGEVMRIWISTVAVCATLASIGIAPAQTYPTRPISLVIPYPPGGSTNRLDASWPSVARIARAAGRH